MTRDFRRGAVVGAILTLMAALGLLYLREGALTAEIVRADARSDSLAVVSEAWRDTVTLVLAGQAEADAHADAESRKAEPIANRLGRTIDRVTVVRDPMPIAPYHPLGAIDDTAAYVGVQRDGDTLTYRAPAWLLADRDSILSDLVQVKLAWEAERAARLHATDILIPALTLQVAALDSLVTSQRAAITLRDAERRPWCGRRCGVVLGSAATVVAVVAVGALAGVAR